MKKWLLMVVLALAGCSSDATPAAAPNPPAAATRAAAPDSGAPVVETREFVTAVRDGMTEVAAGRSDDEIGALGVHACAGLAAGTTADDLVATTRSLGTADAEAVDQATARELIKLAIDTACPDQASRVDEF